MFRAMDTNQDGRVDRQEYQAAMQERFDRMDANGDGLLTRDEVATRFEQMQQRRQAMQQGGE